MKFRHDLRRPDPRWEVASSTQVFSADPETVVRLVRGVDSAVGEGAVDGVVVTRPHPTGWFIWAVRRRDLHSHDRESFAEVVTVRTYLLLRQGPVPGVWSRVPGERDEWRSVVVSLAADVAGIARDLEP